MTNRIVVAAVFLAGCAVGGVSSQLVAVPKASAQQAAVLTKWEMFCVHVDDGGGDRNAKKAAAEGQRLGVEGWEPVGGTDRFWCFKRPKM
jgi:uncharacterized lipoprotein YajG